MKRGDLPKLKSGVLEFASAAEFKNYYSNYLVHGSLLVRGRPKTNIGARHTLRIKIPQLGLEHDVGVCTIYKSQVSVFFSIEDFGDQRRALQLMASMAVGKLSS